MKEILCTYCGSEKNVKTWDKTGELVCLACRFDFLTKEFNLDGKGKMEASMCRDILTL